ncbi:hypothetical protein Srufu_001860 [Streptomyces libani subsp. rufus]|nr:hypothetical protein Srufu_001860 [Streptomyces libani subsp. rufus]
MRTVKGPTDHVVVVGAGLSGLAAALHLLGAGRQVTVVERAALPGGRAGRIESRGYHFDTGPTVLTMPDLIDEAFAAVGERLTDRMELRPLHPAYRARFADGSELDVHTDAEAMTAEVERFAGPRAADGYRRLRRWLQQLYDVQRHRFIDTNFDSPLQLMHPDLARLAALGGFGRLDHRIGRFLPDARLRRVFSFQALYAGVPPARALAAYAVIAFMDTVAGVYFPAAGCTPCPGPWRTRPPTPVPPSATDTPSPGWNAPATGSRRWSPRRNASPVTRWSSPPICRWSTGCSAGAPAARSRSATHRPR